MTSRPKASEYQTFTHALRKVLTVSHSEMKSMLDTEKAQKKRKPRRASASRVSTDKA